MAALSDHIEVFILHLLQDSDEAELQRNKLADQFNCAPSQINYVLSTRFTAQQGYLIESRRGGGGYIRIIRLRDDGDLLLQALSSALDWERELDRKAAEAHIGRLQQNAVIDPTQAVLMKAAIGDEALGEVVEEDRGRLRLSLFRSMLWALRIMECQGRETL